MKLARPRPVFPVLDRFPALVRRGEGTRYLVVGYVLPAAALVLPGQGPDRAGEI